jgi:peptidoglycan/xylan/chitin deacetylase (PgdA/CDA1 family)
MSDVLVLCYHAVSERWTGSQAVTPQRFEQQLRYLLRRGYRGATFHGAVTASSRGKIVAITFDDAYRSVMDVASPILDRLGLPATVFVPTDYVDRQAPMTWEGNDEWLGGPYEREIVPMTWDELGTLPSRGWEIGSHTRSHAKLTTLQSEALEAELRGSRQVCEERLGVPCRTLAYPYGDVDERVIEATRAAGYEAAGALPKRLRSPRLLEWPRVGIYHRDSQHWWHYRLKVSRGVRTLRSSPVWNLYLAARPR